MLWWRYIKYLSQTKGKKKVDLGTHDLLSYLFFFLFLTYTTVAESLISLLQILNLSALAANYFSSLAKIVYFSIH